MVILGISDGRDSAAALVVDGALVGAIEQERLDRKRHSGAFPSAAIDCVLDLGGIRARDVDRVVLGGASRPGLPSGVAAALRRTGMHMVGYELVRRQLAPRLLADGYTRATVEVVEHDRAQVSAAYRTQPRETALIVLIDAAADGASVSVDLARGGQINRVFLQSTLATLPGVPARVALPLGCDAAVLGGLVRRGTAPTAIVEALRTLIGFDGNALRAQRLGRGPDAFAALAQRVAPEVFAAAAMEVVEDTVAELVTTFVNRTGVHTVVLAGTLFLDLRLADRIAALPEVTELHVCPGPGGAAAALGAALGAAGTAPTAISLALGPAFDADACYRALSNASLPRDKVDEPDRVAAEAIRAGRIVARFSGRTPFGPAALGLRSLLFDPALSGRVAAAKRRPGALRFRTVAATDPSLGALVRATGLTEIAETSMNPSGEPTPSSPVDAIRAFRALNADLLLLGPYRVEATAGSARQKEPKPTQSSPAR